MTTYYKFINKKSDVLKNGDYVYKMGLNIMNNFNESPSCTPNALYFSNIENIHKFVSHGNILFEVCYPNDANIIQIEDKFKTNKLILVNEITDFDFLHNIYIEAIEFDVFLLDFIPEQHRTYQLCLEAVKTFGLALQFVPNQHKTYDLCLEAVKSHGYALKFTPEEYKNYDLCFEAVKRYGNVLEFVPNQHKIEFLCLKATSSSSSSWTALEFVPENLKQICKDHLIIS
jgi:hypothetical protein